MAARVLSGLIVWSLSAALLLLQVSTARAWRTGRDLPELSTDGRVAWRTGADVVVFGAIPGVEPELLEAAVEGALATWASTGCGAPPLEWQGPVDEAAMSGDGRVTIQIVASQWTDGRDVPATTELLYQPVHDGAVIVDADVWINAADVVWSTDGEGTATDLEAVLVHELGHALGLLHTCDLLNGRSPCAPAAIEDIPTMDPLYRGLEQRSLETDDVAGYCFLYPAPLACVRDDDCAPLDCGARSPACASATCTCLPPDLGAPCERSDQCLDALCVEPGPLGYCTVSCADAPCPSGFACRESSAGPLCVLPAASCAIAPPSARRSGSGPSWMLLAVLGAVLGALRARLARRARRHIAHLP